MGSIILRAIRRKFTPGCGLGSSRTIRRRVELVDGYMGALKIECLREGVAGRYRDTQMVGLP